MWQIVIVGLGGFTGSILRYLISGWVQRLSGSPAFGYGTLTVNVLGCLAIGLLGGWAEHAGLFGPSTRLFLFLGVLGGFTTFSTFGYETMVLLRSNAMLGAFLYVALHLLLGFGAVALGYGLSTLKG